MSPRPRLSPHTTLAALGSIAIIAAAAWMYTQSTSDSKEVSGLPYYIEAHRLDPIFAIAGTDTAKLSTAVGHLQSEQGKIAELYPGTQGTTIVESLHPITFLAKLPSLESARVQLLADPSVAKAKLYHTLLVGTIDAYRADVESLASTIESLARSIPSVGYLGGTVTPKDFATKLRQVASAAAAQKDKENARFACLKAGTSTECTPLESLRITRDSALKAPTRLPEPPATLPMTDAIVSALLKLSPNYHSLGDYIAAFPSRCLVEPVTYTRAFYARNTEGGLGRKLAIVNNAYFYNLLHTLSPRPPLVDEQIRAGATIQFQNMGNLYECPNAGLDALELGRIVGVRDSIAHKSNKTDEDWALLAKPTLQKADLAPYAAAAAYSSNPEAQELVERYIEGSANFDQVVMGAYSDNHFLIVLDKSKYQVEFNYMMMARNFASALYLIGNPTFVPTPIDLFTERADTPLTNLTLRDYVSDLSNVMSDEEIVRQIGIANGVAAKYFNAAP